MSQLERIRRIREAKEAQLAQTGEKPEERSAWSEFWWGDNDPTTQNFGEKLGTWLNMGGESMTMGLVGDEAAAKFDEAIGRNRNAQSTKEMFSDRSRNYDDRLKEYRADEKQMRDENPWASYGADIAGALPAAVVGAGVIGRGLTLGRQAFLGSALGGAAGGTYGAMEGEGGAQNRLMSGAVGAGLGGTVGAAAPAVTAAAGRGVDALRKALRNRQAQNRTAQSLGVNPKTSKLLTQMVENENPQAMRVNMQRAAPGDDMLADSGQFMAGALDTTMQAPGTAGRVARGRIDARAASAGDALTGALDDTMGPPRGITSLQKAMRESANLTPEYQAAYSKPIRYDTATGQKLLEMQDRLPPQVVNYANNLMRLRGEKSAQIMASVADDGSVTFTRPPDVRQWDYLKQALQALGEEADGQGAMGGQTRMGSAYNQAAREIRDALKDAVPEYGTAIESAADVITQIQGVKKGASIISSGTTREAVAEMMEGATGPERAAMRAGLRQQIDDIVARVQAVPSDPNIDARETAKLFKMLSDRSTKAKLQMVLGDDAWSQVAPKIQQAEVALGLRASVAQNSRTAPRQFMDEFFKDNIEPGPIRRGHVPQALSSVPATAMGANPSQIANKSAAIRAELADVLSRRGQGLNVLNTIEGNGANAALPPMSAARARLLTALGVGTAANAPTAAFNQRPQMLRPR